MYFLLTSLMGEESDPTEVRLLRGTSARPRRLGSPPLQGDAARLTNLRVVRGFVLGTCAGLTDPRDSDAGYFRGIARGCPRDVRGTSAGSMDPRNVHGMPVGPWPNPAFVKHLPWIYWGCEIRLYGFVFSDR